MSNEKMREEFEAWATEDFGLVSGHFLRDGDEYTNFPTQCYWEAWKGSRAVIEIELYEPSDLASPDAHIEHGYAKDQIEAHGLKVKIMPLEKLASLPADR